MAEQFRIWDSIARTLPDTKIVPTILTGDLIDSICSTRLYSWLRSDDDEREDDEGLTLEEIDEINDFCKLSDEVMRSIAIQGKGSARWSEVVTDTLDWCLTMGYEVDAGDALFPKLVRQFARVEQEAHRNIEQRNLGNGTATPAPLEVRESLSTITEVFRMHKSIRSGTAHVGAMVNAWVLFIEYCGDIALDSVTVTHIFEFMEARMKAKKKPWSEKRAKEFGIRTLREIFGLARAKGLMTIANPADGMEAFPTMSKEDEADHKQPRYPFTSAQLNTLLGSAWYDPTERVQFTGKMKTDLGARYWTPLIGLCHGNRVGEGVQFIASDFSFDGELLVMSFRTELEKSADDEKNSLDEKINNGQTLTLDELKKLRHLKNKQTQRVVPIHPLIVALGFAEFVDQRRRESGHNALLFPSSAPKPGGKRPKLGRAYEQAFLRFVRDKLGFGHGFGNHSFRHQLEDRIRNAQTPELPWPSTTIFPPITSTS